MTRQDILRRSALAGLGLLLLAGCAATDPYQREGMWRPNGANASNLRTMVVSPADLVRGVEEPGSSGQQAAMALDRMRQEKVRALPDSAVAKIVPVPTSSPDTAAIH
jgi:type IV pilus biogenesis protein CpaD/CtpE